MSVARLQAEISSSEFVDWIAYLEKDINEFHREDYLFAQIAAEVRRSWVKNYNDVDPSDFLIKLEPKKEKKKLTLEEASSKAKRFFGVSQKVIKNG